MRIEDLNWMDVEKYLKKEDRLMVILGATEQHGYLSLCSDTRIPQALADAASQKSGVLIAPALPFGISPSFLSYPGTISLRVETCLQVVDDFVRSVYGYGFRKLLFINGHGGNDPVRGKISELMNSLPGLKANWYSWWVAPRMVEFSKRKGLENFHANWEEAFAFNRICPLPDGIKEPPRPHGLMSAEQTRLVYGDGVFGGAYQADEPTMTELFEICLTDILMLLEGWC